MLVLVLGAGAGAVSWLCNVMEKGCWFWCRAPALVLGAGCRCWCCELAWWMVL